MRVSRLGSELAWQLGKKPPRTCALLRAPLRKQRIQRLVGNLCILSAPHLVLSALLAI